MISNFHAIIFEYHQFLFQFWKGICLSSRNISDNLCGKLNFPWPTGNLTFAPRMRMPKWQPSPYNFDLDITNILVVSPQVRYIEVFDLTNPRFNEQIWPVPGDFVKSRFHCNYKFKSKLVIFKHFLQ